MYRQEWLVPLVPVTSTHVSNNFRVFSLIPLCTRGHMIFWATPSSLSLHHMNANLSRDLSQLTLRPPGFTLKIHATEDLISRNLE